MKQSWIIFIVACLCCACSGVPAQPAAPTAVPTVEESATPIPTLPPTPTATPTPVYPTGYLTPFPSLASSGVQPDASGLVEVAQWGIGDIRSSAWSPDGTRIAVCTKTGLYVFGYPDLSLVMSISPWEWMDWMVFTPDGSKLAIIGDHLRVWDLNLKEIVLEMDSPPIVMGLRFDDATGKLIALFRQSESSPLLRWVVDIDSQQMVETSYDALKDYSITVSSTLNYAVSKFTDAKYILWDLVSNTEMATTKLNLNQWVGGSACAISGDGSLLMLCGRDGMHVFKVGSNAIYEIAKYDYLRPVKELTNGVLLMTKDITGQLLVRDFNQGQLTTTPVQVVLPVSLSADQQFLLDGKGRVVSLASWRDAAEVAQMPEFTRECCTVSVSGKYWTGFDNGNLVLFDGQDGSLLATVAVTGEPWNDRVMIAPTDDRLVRLNTARDVLEVYSLPTLALTASIPLAPARADTLAQFYFMDISQDGEFLALSGLNFGYLLLVDLLEGKISRSLQGRYWELVFHPSGLLAVRNVDRLDYTLKINPYSGEVVGKLPGQQINRISPDGVNLVVRTGDTYNVQDWESGKISATSALEMAFINRIFSPLAQATGYEVMPLLWLTTYVPSQGRFYVQDAGVFRVFEQGR